MVRAHCDSRLGCGSVLREKFPRLCGRKTLPAALFTSLRVIFVGMQDATTVYIVLVPFATLSAHFAQVVAGETGVPGVPQDADPSCGHLEPDQQRGAPHCLPHGGVGRGLLARARACRLQHRSTHVAVRTWVLSVALVGCLQGIVGCLSVPRLTLVLYEMRIYTFRLLLVV